VEELVEHKVVDKAFYLLVAAAVQLGTQVTVVEEVTLELLSRVTQVLVVQEAVEAQVIAVKLLAAVEELDYLEKEQTVQVDLPMLVEMVPVELAGLAEWAAL
jgi:heme oxygenase